MCKSEEFRHQRTTEWSAGGQATGTHREAPAAEGWSQWFEAINNVGPCGPPSDVNVGLDSPHEYYSYKYDKHE